MSEDYTHEPNRYEAVLKIELIALRADLEQAVVALRMVLDGMTVQELAALADLVEALEERYGLEVKA